MASFEPNNSSTPQRKATFLRFNQLIKQHTVTKVMINGYNVQFKNLNTYILGENLFELYETLK